MSIRYKHADIYSTYFCTFTFFNWMHLFELTNSYDLVYKWFKILKDKYNGDIIAYVIMPNHLHCILYFANEGFKLNNIIANGKRFMVYEIIIRLEANRAIEVLHILSENLTEREKKKGQLHKVFKDSFDAKASYSDKFMKQKMDYIHHNPVSGKWQLVNDFTEYIHSSAAFYELGISNLFTPLHYRNI